MSMSSLNETERVINREFVDLESEMRCNSTDSAIENFECQDLTETMIQYENLSYCSNCAKAIKEIADSDDSEKIEVKPIFRCPAKSCDAKLTFKLFWTNSCCVAAIRKHSMEEVESLIQPAEEKLKKSREEVARIYKMRNEELAKIDKLQNAAVKRKNEDKAELASLQALKTRIIEKTVGARYLCNNPSCKKEFKSSNYKTNKNIECMLKCSHSICLECVDRGIKDGDNGAGLCPVVGCSRSFSYSTIIRVTRKNLSVK